MIDESASLDDDRKPSGFPQTFTNTDPNGTPITYTEVLTCDATHGDRTESNTAVLTELDTNTVRTDPAAVAIDCIPPSEGCTPGFWAGGVGDDMWNAVNDPDWTANGATGTNPFIHTTLFNSFFTTHSSLNGLTMFDLVSTGGGSETVRKTARMLVAAYLSSSAGLNNGFTTAQLSAAWTAYLAGDTSSTTLFNALAAANELGCPLPR